MSLEVKCQWGLLLPPCLLLKATRASSPVCSHFFTLPWWWLECSVETSPSYLYFPSSSWQQTAFSSFMQKRTEKLQVNTVLSIVARCNGSSKVLLCTYMYTNETRTALHVTTCCHAPRPINSHVWVHHYSQVHAPPNLCEKSQTESMYSNHPFA